MAVTQEQEVILRSIGTVLRETRDSLRNESASSHRAVLEAVGRTLQGRLERVEEDTKSAAEKEARRVVAGVLRPEVTVRNDVSSPPAQVVVRVDMTPVADAVDRMTASVKSLGGMIADLIGALRDATPAVVKSTVNVPETSVTVEPAHVTVEAPRNRKRRLVVKHSDGSESVVTEE